jgi:hypothetical protein
MYQIWQILSIPTTNTLSLVAINKYGAIDGIGVTHTFA